MKIEKINSNKIKVMIDDDEAKAWNVNIKSISQNTPQVQDMFWKAIRKAEREMEFFVDGAKLFAIAAYCGMGVRPTPDGAQLDPALFLEKSL